MSRDIGQQKSTTEKGTKTSASVDKVQIELAIQKSPSGNNSKPFAAEWKGDVLILKHIPENSEHYLNRANQAALIALGCTLASIEMAAESQGLRASFNLPQLENPNWNIDIGFEELSSKTSTTLLNQILKRTTYRKTFRESFVSPEIQVALENVKIGSIGLKIRTSSQLNPEFKKFIVKCENYIWGQERATRDFINGVQLLRTKPASRGIARTKLGINFGQTLFLYVTKLIPRLPSVLMKFSVFRKVLSSVANTNFKNSHFLLVYGTGLEATNLVQAGQAAMKAWITLETAGYKAQPMSAASISLVDAANGILPPDTTQEFSDLFNHVGPRLLKDQFQLTPREKCIWILRFGKAS